MLVRQDPVAEMLLARAISAYLRSGSAAKLIRNSKPRTIIAITQAEKWSDPDKIDDSGSFCIGATPPAKYPEREFAYLSSNQREPWSSYRECFVK